MQQLHGYVKKAQLWVEKAESIKTSVCQVKQLQNLLQEARGIPVNFGKLLEDIHKRSSESQQLAERVHTQFIKVSKTRTQVEQEQQRKEKKEQLFRDIIREADALMITSGDIQKLRDHLEEVEDWKRRAEMFLNDDREQRAHKEFFTQLIKETRLFKFEVDLTEELQVRFEFFEWLDRVEQLWARISSGDEWAKVSLLDLQAVMQDGEQKGFAEVQLEVIQQVGGACLRANKFEQELRKSLKEIKDPSNKDRKQPISIEQLLDLQREAKELRVWLPDEEELAQIINEVDSFDAKCKLILARAELLKQADLVDGPTFLSEVLDLEQQVRRLGVSNPTFRAFRQFTNPLRRWIHYSHSLIRTYLRSMAREFPQSLAQLDLLPQQDYESDSSGCEGERAVPDHDMLTLVL